MIYMGNPDSAQHYFISPEKTENFALNSAQISPLQLLRSGGGEKLEFSHSTDFLGVGGIGVKGHLSLSLSPLFPFYRSPDDPGLSLTRTFRLRVSNVHIDSVSRTEQFTIKAKITNVNQLRRKPQFPH